MSFEVRFIVRRERPFDEELLVARLAAQRHWTRADASGAVRWWYRNPDTGVYCTLEHDDAPAPAGYTSAKLLAALNYARPSFFALETVPLIVELAAASGLLVIDPQDHELGGSGRPKEARAEDLIATWRAGNRLALAAARASGITLPAMPRDRAHAWWRYQSRRGELAAQLGESAYAPDLKLVRRRDGNEVQRLLVWSEGNPSLLPACDVVAVVRPLPGGELAMRGCMSYGDLLSRLAPYLSEHTAAEAPLLAADRAMVVPRLPDDALAPFEGYEAVGADAFTDEGRSERRAYGSLGYD